MASNTGIPDRANPVRLDRSLNLVTEYSPLPQLESVNYFESHSFQIYVTDDFTPLDAFNPGDNNVNTTALHNIKTLYMVQPFILKDIGGGMGTSEPPDGATRIQQLPVCHISNLLSFRQLEVIQFDASHWSLIKLLRIHLRHAHPDRQLKLQIYMDNWLGLFKIKRLLPTSSFRRYALLNDELRDAKTHFGEHITGVEFRICNFERDLPKHVLTKLMYAFLGTLPYGDSGIAGGASHWEAAGKSVLANFDPEE